MYYLWSIFNHLLSTIYYLLSIMYYLPTVYYLWPIICYELSIIYYLLSVNLKFCVKISKLTPHTSNLTRSGRSRILTYLKCVERLGRKPTRKPTILSGVLSVVCCSFRGGQTNFVVPIRPRRWRSEAANSKSHLAPLFTSSDVVVKWHMQAALDGFSWHVPGFVAMYLFLGIVPVPSISRNTKFRHGKSRPIIYDTWYMKYDFWNMIDKIWYMKYDIWYMKYDIWNMIYEIWYITYHMKYDIFALSKTRMQICCGIRYAVE